MYDAKKFNMTATRVGGSFHWEVPLGKVSFQGASFTPSKRFGLTDTRNVSHGSDSEQTARAEINFFFPEFSETQWEREEKEYFQTGRVIFDWEQFVHRPARSTD